jgi:hypothetical protein
MVQIIKDWQGNEIGIVPGKNENPMLIHGRGPSGKQCGDCAHLIRNHHRSAVHFKCECYKLTHGAATDIKLKWPACKKFEQQVGGRDTIYTE